MHGGRAEHGWRLWEILPGVLLEVEFHGVWIDPDGGRLDFYEATNRGALADYHGYIRLMPEMEAIAERGMRLEAEIPAKYFSG